MKKLFYILVFVLSIGCTIAEATTDKAYTCKEACNNYKKCKCKSDLDKYNCIDACHFAQSVGMISQKQLNCIITAKNCKKMFSCVGYDYKNKQEYLECHTPNDGTYKLIKGKLYLDKGGRQRILSFCLDNPEQPSVITLPIFIVK